MTCNIGGLDRIARLVLGLALLAATLLTDAAAGALWLRWGAIVVGLVLVVTAGLRFCPLYTLIGVRTCRP